MRLSAAIFFLDQRAAGSSGFLNLRQLTDRQARYGEPIQHTGNVLREITDGWT
jgi:hypothetical protein